MINFEISVFTVFMSSIFILSCFGIPQFTRYNWDLLFLSFLNVMHFVFVVSQTFSLIHLVSFTHLNIMNNYCTSNALSVFSNRLEFLDSSRIIIFFICSKMPSALSKQLVQNSSGRDLFTFSCLSLFVNSSWQITFVH